MMNNTKHKITALCAILCVFFLVADASPADEDCNKDVDTFDSCNNPKVIKYLEKLTKKDKGITLKGVRLTDGTIELKGYIFLVEAKNVGKGVHLYIFSFKKYRIAYIWIDEDGTELNLPSCPQSVSFESTYGLSGDVYTFAALQPGHGVVHTMCVKKEWLKKLE
jgi:hypothetical protein